MNLIVQNLSVFFAFLAVSVCLCARDHWRSAVWYAAHPSNQPDPEYPHPCTGATRWELFQGEVCAGFVKHSLLPVLFASVVCYAFYLVGEAFGYGFPVLAVICVLDISSIAISVYKDYQCDLANKRVEKERALASWSHV